MVVVAALARWVLASLVKLGSSCRALSLRGLSLGWWASWWFVGWSCVLVVVGVGVLVWSVLVLVFGACVCVCRAPPLCFITVPFGGGGRAGAMGPGFFG